MYDISTHTERRITTTLSNEKPSISYNLIAYEKWITQNNIQTQAVFYYNLTSNKETQLSNSGDSNYNPAISNTRIVYESSRVSEMSSLTLVVMRDVSNNTTWETNVANQENPDIDGNYIVYEGSSWYLSGTSIIYTTDIYLYNIDTGVTTQITNDNKNQINPAVNGGLIVYQDDRNGNWDIYMTVVVVAVAGPTPTGLPRVGAAGPGNTQSETETLSPTPSVITLITAVAVIAIAIASITLAVYYKKHKSQTLTKKNTETT